MFAAGQPDQSAFEAMANARIDLQAAQEAYDAVVANN